jgi:hypothetical protein
MAAVSEAPRAAGVPAKPAMAANRETLLNQLSEIPENEGF